jgi:Domain of unknown function (DUF397)
VSEAEPKVLPLFVRSSYCQGGMCVEVAHVGDEVLLRDGKDPSIPPLRFSEEEWCRFVAQCRRA